jgi:hypothetical protein
MGCRGGGRPPRCEAVKQRRGGCLGDASLFGACDPVAGQGIGFQVEVAFTGGEVLPFEDVRGEPGDAVGRRQAGGGALGVQGLLQIHSLDLHLLAGSQQSPRLLRWD